MTLRVLATFAGALAVAVAITPVARRIAWRTGLTDTPSARKVHTTPMPLLGGAAIYVAAMCALLLFVERREVTQLAGILLGASVVSALGLWDDRRPVPPRLKLAIQAVAAGLTVASGVQVRLLAPDWANVAIAVLWIVVVTNAVNFMDNMDGLAGGVAAVAAGHLVIMAVLNDQQLVAPLAAALLGACIGFLVYNFHPASIFMGDAGSLFLGFSIAALAIKLRFPGRPTDVTWIVPILLLGVPLFDLALVMASRIRRRVNPFTTAGKDHLAHRIVRLGATRREATLGIYLLACACGALALFVSLSTFRETAIIGLCGLALGAWGVWRLERDARGSA